jgi:hypothetical protein
MAENPGYVFHMYIVCAYTHSAVVLQNYYQITHQGSAGVQADGCHLSNHTHDEVYRSRYIQQSAVISSTYLIGAKILIECLRFYVQAYTLYSSVWPFGVPQSVSKCLLHRRLIVIPILRGMLAMVTGEMAEVVNVTQIRYGWTTSLFCLKYMKARWLV